MNASRTLKSSNANRLRLPDVNIRRVLVPVDFSACTLETLCYAVALARPFDAVVDVLHVIQAYRDRNRGTWLHPGLLRTMSEGARHELTRLVGVLRTVEDRDKFSIRIREGCASEVILNEASSSNATLIIMGMRTRSWLSRWMRRHTTRQVIQNSSCPVIVMRSGMKASLANRFGTDLLPRL
jgi:nucleotide-binding universal stress UspA family protein